MNRKAILTEDYYVFLQKKRTHSPRTKATYARVMAEITHALHKMDALPLSWQSVTQQTLEQLIAFWKDKGNAVRTIHNKLSMFKTVLNALGCQSEFPENQTLLPVEVKSLTSQKNIISFDLSAIEDELTYHLMAFEVHFGLTKMESIRYKNALDITMDEGYLTIHRDIAYNSRRRTIPVLTDVQRTLLKKRVGFINHPVAFFQKAKVLRKRYQRCVNVYNVPSMLRRLYIQRRFASLSELGEGKAMDTLCQEVGFTTRQILRRYLCHP